MPSAGSWRTEAWCGRLDRLSDVELNIYFLLFSLFFPRLVLVLFIFFWPALYPANSVPQWADIALGIFFPRVLILVYIYQNLGANNVWFIAHLVVMILAYFGGSRETNRRRRNRRAEG